MKFKNTLYSGIIVISFLIAVYGFRVLANFVDFPIKTKINSILYNYLWWIIPVVFVTGFLYGFKNIISELSLDKGFKIGVLFSGLVALPMFVSSAIIGQIDYSFDLFNVLQKSFGSGFFEELLFRGFLFGLLFRKLKWGFIPAALLGAVIFGIGHLYQGHNTGEAISVFLVTFMGALWFAWLYIEWDNNLWIPIFLHIFMNLSWILFDVSENAIGDLTVNIFRIITILLTVGITVSRNIRRKRFNIRAETLFVNRLT